MELVTESLHAIPYDQILIQTLNGIVAGMILALVASGLTLIFGIMDVVNFAHGELFMLGAYVGGTTWVAAGRLWRAPGGPRPPHHHPVHLRALARAAELRPLAVRAGGPQDPGAGERPLPALLPR